ncbi:hypothetical protein KSL88_10230 [Pectobacterium polaris]|uniref:hypothetical protein n=1 Tax=Pectobacterium polaris TaxID=2042057 RepID=UPI001CC3BBE6|nr:hypothetical protein [Pectobacterium polaris]UAY94420.1 hypothetical protein KSL88_10230 [Pectobacterium polaris]
MAQVTLPTYDAGYMVANRIEPVLVTPGASIYGQIEVQSQLKKRQPDQPHLMVDVKGLLKQLAALRAGALERLAVEQAREQK